MKKIGVFIIIFILMLISQKGFSETTACGCLIKEEVNPQGVIYDCSADVMKCTLNKGSNPISCFEDKNPVTCSPVNNPNECALQIVSSDISPCTPGWNIKGKPLCTPGGTEDVHCYNSGRRNVDKGHIEMIANCYQGPLCEESMCLYKIVYDDGRPSQTHDGQCTTVTIPNAQPPGSTTIPQ